MAKFTPISHMYVFDLESCDGEHVYPEVVARQRVWLCGYMNVATQVMHSYTSLDVCLDAIFKLGGHQNVEVAVHNLAFDGSFIVPALVNLGYQPVSSTKPRVGEFSVLIDERNNWYTIQVQVQPKKRVMFWDSLKLFPMALKHLHLVYHTPTKKVSEPQEFYHRYRPEPYEPDEDELFYLDHDLRVLAEVLEKHIHYFGLGFKKTQASQAFYEFTTSFPAWKLRFPALDEKVDQDVRLAYWGGISYVNPLYEGQDLENVHVYDINSSYPYQLATKPMPYGKIILSMGEGAHPQMGKFWVAKAIVSFKLKPHKVPCIPRKAIAQEEHFMDEKWVKDSKGVVELTFSSIDYLTIQQSYDFEVIHWLWSLHWAQKVHKELRQYIVSNNDDKNAYKELFKQAKGELKWEYFARSQRSKINNNSFYGKFGEEIIKIGKSPVVVNGLVEYVNDRYEILNKYKRKFLPIAIATTAYGRQQFVEFANLMGEYWVYGDTDSCHFLDAGSFRVWDFEFDDLCLGAWSHDATFKQARYLRPKTYIGLNQDQWEVTCAGLPADEDALPGEKKRTCCTWENFHIGTVIPDGNGKLRTISTPTGKKLVETSFEIGASFLFEF